MSQHVVHEAACPRARVSTRSVVSPHALPRRPRVPARGRFSLPIRHVSLRRSPRRAVASRRTASLAADTPLAAPPRSPHRSPSLRRSARRAAPLVDVALLHVPLVGIAFLHAQGPHSAQYRRANGTGVQKRRGNDASVQYRRGNVTTGRPPMHMSRWRNERHKNCALNWAVRSPSDSRQVFSTSPLLPCTRRTEETWAQNGTSR